MLVANQKWCPAVNEQSITGCYRHWPDRAIVVITTSASLRRLQASREKGFMARCSRWCLQYWTAEQFPFTRSELLLTALVRSDHRRMDTTPAVCVYGVFVFNRWLSAPSAVKRARLCWLRRPSRLIWRTIRTSDTHRSLFVATSRRQRQLDKKRTTGLKTASYSPLHSLPT